MQKVQSMRPAEHSGLQVSITNQISLTPCTEVQQSQPEALIPVLTSQEHRNAM